MSTRLNSTAIKFFLWAVITALGLLVSGALIASSSEPVLIESLESKTIEQSPVYNKIQFYPGLERDVWMMQQSHHGLGDSKPWDRLAIVVDKTTEPKTAKFYQLEPGPLVWNENVKRQSFRVSCFFCHNNGPRAIRPNFESTQVSLSLKDKAVLAAWNLRIKTYGRILPNTEHDKLDLDENEVSFRSHASIDNDELAIESCAKCHRDGGLFARGALRRQQAMTISFMVESGQMPPPGFSLSDEDRNTLKNFLNGF